MSLNRKTVPTINSLAELRRAFYRLGNTDKARQLQKYFRTGPGEYGHGDVFLGITVPQIRKMVKQCGALSRQEILELLQSQYHEERLLALLILVARFNQGDEKQQKSIYRLYLKHKNSINNWDLVDLSAPNIVGTYLLNHERGELYTLARSKRLWDRRIAILATLAFIKHGQFADTLNIAEILLQDKEDLIHKAVGWMLRETGKHNLDVEEAFLQTHYQRMPRTMLRYAIEKFTENRRQQYLKGKVKR
ncbi:MAG: DNA alkylation repair protein [Gammaproteobacteria bacterium]|nr:DNA alkylation repair protein [Gammaproteobacteria bacterium]